MYISLKGKTALVTGASRGIGKSIAQSLADSGARVVGTATTQSGADSISKYLSSYLKQSGLGMVLDVSNRESIDSFFSVCKDKSVDFDILINNAGITRDNLLLRMDDEQWQSVIDTNLSSVFYMLKGVVRTMMKNRWGRIINISSVVATIGNPGQLNYVASKGAIESMTKTLASELASRNILVNSVAPGFIATDMTDVLSEEQKKAITNNIPLARMGLPDDIASVVVFLCSQQASYISGQTLHVNGAMV